MRAELKVPKVFEPGARVAIAGEAAVGVEDLRWVVSREVDGVWWGWSGSSGKELPLIHVDALPSDALRVIAPAPREGQRWESERRDIRVGETRNIANGQTSLFVSLGFGYPPEFIADSAVLMSRWLLEHGYSYAGPADAAPATLRASEPTPAAASPAPWTLTAARCLITETIASAKPRRPAAFTAALCALAEHGVPPAKLVIETAATITALEAALPVHGAVARWQAERALWEMRDRLKGKLNGTQTIIALAAATIYLQRRGAW